MNIQNISKDKGKTTIELSADELVIICNALYSQLDEKKDSDRFLQLYSDMMLARDLCQYGHVDNFCLSNIVECRNSMENGLDGVLSDEDIETFKSYLGDYDMPIAFRNTDWQRVYKKIVGEHGQAIDYKKIRQWMGIDDEEEEF